MATIKQKYADNRSKILDGDFILFRGTGITSSVIRVADKSYFSHIGRVVKLHNRYLIIDSNADGNHPEWLSTRIEKYNSDSDFCIVRSKKSEEIVHQNIISFINQADDERTKYDFSNGIKEVLNRAFGLNLKIKLSSKYNICSQSVRKSFEQLDMGTTMFYDLEIALPQDYVRYLNHLNALILFKDES